MSESEIYEIYGHKYTEDRIRALFPYSGTVVSEQETKNCRITYDCYSAMQLKLKQTPVKEWGCKYKGRTAFVFQCATPKAIAFN